MDARKKRLQEIRTELHDLANSYGGGETGTIAVAIHQAANELLWPLQMIEKGVTDEDRAESVDKWIATQPGLLAIIADSPSLDYKP